MPIAFVKAHSNFEIFVNQMYQRVSSSFFLHQILSNHPSKRSISIYFTYNIPWSRVLWISTTANCKFHPKTLSAMFNFSIFNSAWCLVGSLLKFPGGTASFLFVRHRKDGKSWSSIVIQAMLYLAHLMFLLFSLSIKLTSNMWLTSLKSYFLFSLGK